MCVQCSFTLLPALPWSSAQTAFVLRACAAQDKNYDSLIGMVTTPEGDPPPSHPMRLSAPGGPTLPA